MIDGQNFFDEPVKNNLKTYDNIQKIATSQGDDYTTGSLLDYPYFKEYYNMIPIDLSKQQTLDADPKAIQQINFAGNLDRYKNITMFLIVEETKKNHFTFFTRNCESVITLFCHNIKII